MLEIGSRWCGGEVMSRADFLAMHGDAAGYAYAVVGSRIDPRPLSPAAELPPDADRVVWFTLRP
jgi:hypothetical protein